MDRDVYSDRLREGEAGMLIMIPLDKEGDAACRDLQLPKEMPIGSPTAHRAACKDAYRDAHMDLPQGCL